MSIDISQFLDTFYEESFEGLDTMEGELLELNPASPDQETINTIFRAAHSIKGGSGTFGLSAVAEFTHVLETLLDEVRGGERSISQSDVDLMLTSVDVLREMLTALKKGSEVDTARIADVHQQLERLLDGDNSISVEKSNQVAAVAVHSGSCSQWNISFRPHENIFMTGNDPLRLLRELAEMGDIAVTVDTSKIPGFYLLNPEDCHISWTISFAGEATEEQIKEVFLWVEDECDLLIERVDLEHIQQNSEPSVTPDSIVTSKTNVTPVKSAAETADAIEHEKVQVKKSPSTESGSIRVGIDKVDVLINMVGELVITQSMLNQLGEDFSMDRVEQLQEGLSELERHTRELQENVMKIRMLPISFSFNRFPRLVHDLSSKLNKKVELKVSGEQTELDKTVMEKIGDPLVHLVRNSLDHGIESPEVRVKKGKPETGILHLNAYHQGGNIVIDIIDDGAGLDTEKIFKKAVEKGLISSSDTLLPEKIYELIFQPGFSTATEVSDVSGRGVGMDVVRRNINDLGGVVEVSSVKDVGSKFTIRLPLTLAILDGQLIKLGKQTYIIPLVSIIESLQIRKAYVSSIAGDAELYKLREEYVPIVRLHEVFSAEAENTELEGGLLVVVEGDGMLAGIFVDDLLGQQQVVIKSLETNFKKVDGVSGATILGDGTVALILDVSGLVKLAKEKTRALNGAAAVA